MNRLKTVLRSLTKKKFYTVVNILGLSISLATSILIILWVQDEGSFDKFHPDYEQLYTVNSHLNPETNGSIWTSSPGPIARFAQNAPQVELATRVSQDNYSTVVNDALKRPVTGIKISYVDSNFFDMFNFPLLEGSLVHFQTNPTNALITESTAEKLFSSQQAIGKTFRYGEDLFAVVGILKDVPANSSIQFDVVAPLGYHAQRFTKWGGNGQWKTIDEDLGNYSFQTYIKAQPNNDPLAIGKSITASYTEARNGENSTAFMLAPLEIVHLIAADGNKAGLWMVQIFGAIAALLLIIGAVNYVNLSTARAIDRAKEVSIRKVIGASRSALFMQFVLETVVVFVLSLLIALGLIFLLAPGYSEIAQKSLHYSLSNGALWKYIGAAVFVTLCLSSIYPALQLSAFNPVESLKGKTTRRISSNTLRKVLVVFQFTIAVTLMVCTLVIRNQLEFIRQINLGYDKDHVLTLGLPGEAYNHMDAIRAELTSNPAIQGVSLSGIWNLIDYFHSTSDIEWPGKSKDNPLVVSQATIDKDFLPLMDIPFLEGSNFSGLPADSSHYIINETLAKEMGLKPPYVGAQMSFHNVPGQIIGVVEDFHFKSVREKIGPMVFWTRWGAGTLYVKTTTAQAQQAINALEAIYNRYPSDTPFSYTFIDAQFDNLYKAEKRTGLLFNIFSGIAIFISALGLFALATHAAQTRIKEIGIRKVLGASIFSIVRLLGKNFVLLVCIAILIACPIALYLMQQWLANFAYKVELSALTFILGSLIAIVIAILTVSYQAIKAAVANPVESLRDE
ncbi:ABC transporter permease [Parapedobacter koreensis]|uniref:ABC-type antimicrobial peptide transport system, permease component n=1 Tax=Parapedobacter koreensis TaxID=332977 RepID=A0A1H7R093_9SPHI|nr:ABC transporter permease [Parapedobacter koreensis]SEL53656.1 ABC-type antimicrobial peptide transport system, permease component [Parapedobacter koreensis]